MNGGSRYACGRDPAGQLPTSRTMSERAPSTQGSSNVARGRYRTQVCQVGGSGPVGGQVSDHSSGRWSKLFQKAKGARASSGRQLLAAAQLVRTRHVRGRHVLVLEAGDLADRPHHGVEHRPVRAGSSRRVARARCGPTATTSPSGRPARTRPPTGSGRRSWRAGPTRSRRRRPAGRWRRRSRRRVPRSPSPDGRRPCSGPRRPAATAVCSSMSPMRMRPVTPTAAASAP